MIERTKHERTWLQTIRLMWASYDEPKPIESKQLLLALHEMYLDGCNHVDAFYYGLGVK